MDDPLDLKKQQHSMIYKGAAAPTLFFVVLVALFTFARHHSPTAPWLVTLLGGAGLLLAAWPNAPVGGRGRLKVEWIPLFSCALALALGIWFGRWNSANMEPYVHGQFLTRYSDVLPSTDPVTVADAGIVHFAAGTVLDTGSSAGFQAWPHVYCAAPIIAGDNPGNSTLKVGFWAVGMDCCKSRESFTCDDADVEATRSGFRVETHMLGKATGHDVSEHFAKAVNMAAAAYGMEVAKDPVFISWQRDPEAAAMSAYQLSLLVFIVLSFLAIGACVTCQQVIQHSTR